MGDPPPPREDDDEAEEEEEEADCVDDAFPLVSEEDDGFGDSGALEDRCLPKRRSKPRGVCVGGFSEDEKRRPHRNDDRIPPDTCRRIDRA